MRYSNIVEGKFIDRPNRFIAHVMVENELHTVHVKNTGRCKELLLPGSRVILQDWQSNQNKQDWQSNQNNQNKMSGSGQGITGKARKTRFDLIAVWKEKLGWVNIDSQAPNVVVKEWLSRDNEIFEGLTLVKPEYKYGDSRVDFYLEQGSRRILMEVKGCTLEIGGEGYFPDAPTERGVKHLNELAGAIMKGYECYIAFVIAMEGVNKVHPNVNTHPQFGEALERAKVAGVKVLYLCCSVEPGKLVIERAIPENGM